VFVLTTHVVGMIASIVTRESMLVLYSAESGSYLKVSFHYYNTFMYYSYTYSNHVLSYVLKDKRKRIKKCKQSQHFHPYCCLQSEWFVNPMLWDGYFRLSEIDQDKLDSAFSLFTPIEIEPVLADRSFFQASEENHDVIVRQIRYTQLHKILVRYLLQR
jgi:hypothetical protein